MTATRVEKDTLGPVNVPADKLWGAQTQRSLQHFSIGEDLIPREMIAAYATLKKAAASANHNGGRLDDQPHRLIVRACDEILSGEHQDEFPLHVWMTGSGTQFNMNVNEVIANCCSQPGPRPFTWGTPSRSSTSSWLAAPTRGCAGRSRMPSATKERSRWPLHPTV